MKWAKSILFITTYSTFHCGHLKNKWLRNSPALLKFFGGGGERGGGVGSVKQNIIVFTNFICFYLAKAYL